MYGKTVIRLWLIHAIVDNGNPRRRFKGYDTLIFNERKLITLKNSIKKASVLQRVRLRTQYIVNRIYISLDLLIVCYWNHKSQLIPNAFPQLSFLYFLYDFFLDYFKKLLYHANPVHIIQILIRGRVYNIKSKKQIYASLSFLIRRLI